MQRKQEGRVISWGAQVALAALLFVATWWNSYRALAGSITPLPDFGGVQTLTGTDGIAVNGLEDVGFQGTVTVSPTYGPVGDIQSVGTANAAGTVVRISRSNHTHQGVHSLIAGSGITVSGAYGDVTVGATGVPAAHAPTHQPGGSDTLDTTFTVTTRLVTAGAYLAGGGDFSANRTVDLEIGSVSVDVTPTWTNVQGKPSTFTPSAHASTHHPGGGDPLDATYTVTTRQVLAGVGMTGGGNLSTDPTLNVDSAVITPTWTNLQSIDAEIAALAGLVSAADQLPYFTGSGTAALTTLTAYGRSLIDDVDAATARTTLGLGTIATQAANSVAITGGNITGITDLTVADGGTGASTAADARTNLGLVIGTNVQAQDAELQAIAGLVSAADQLPYFTGSGTAALTALSATGRSILDDTSVSAVRGTLEFPAGLVTTGNPAQFLNAALLLATPGVTITGDVTGSGSTFAATIANDAVTYAKMQNVSAADLIWGRSTAGAGDVEEIACTAAGRTLIAGASAAAQATSLGLGTGDSPQFTAVNIGHATDTTLTRTGAGDIAVEGNAVYRAGGTDVPVADGGTGASTMALGQYNLGVGNPTAAGDLLAGMADGRWYRVANGTTNQLLHATTAGTATWGAVVEADQTLADNTTNDASTTKHGYVPKLTAPGAGLLNAMGIGNGETALTAKALFDTTNPADLGTAAPGTQLVAARRDHVHAALTVATQDLVATATTALQMNATPSVTVTAAAAAGTTNVTYTGYEANPIDNGDFLVAQRGATLAAADYDAVTLTLDRWNMFSGIAGINLTVSQVASSLTGHRYAGKIQRTVSEATGGASYFATVLGTPKSIPYQGQTISLSWWSKCGTNFSPTSNIVTPHCVTGTGTDQTGVALFGGTWTGVVDTGGSNVSLTTTWQKFTQTFMIPSNATEIAFYFRWDTTGTAGADDSIYFTGVRSNLGYVEAPYVWVQSEEEERCSESLLAFGGENLFEFVASGFVISATQGTIVITFPVRMRAIPSLVVPDVTLWAVANSAGGGATVALTNLVLDRASTKSISLTFTHAGTLTAGNATALIANNSASARLYLSAEL